MATVYLARLTGVGGFQRFFALKRLHPHLAGEKEFVEMFLDEARLAAGIHHPTSVPFPMRGGRPRGRHRLTGSFGGGPWPACWALPPCRRSGVRPPVPCQPG